MEPVIRLGACCGALSISLMGLHVGLACRACMSDLHVRDLDCMARFHYIAMGYGQ